MESYLPLARGVETPSRRWPSWSSDAVLVASLLAWFATGKAPALLHVLTLAVMASSLAAGYARGLLAGWMRCGAALAAVLAAHPGHLADVGAMAACSALAAVFGAAHREDRRRLGQAVCQTLEALGHALEARDSYTEGHSLRVASYARRLAEALDRSTEERAQLERAAALHDLGKIAISDAILGKGGPLTPAERREMARHPGIGAAILGRLDFLSEDAPLVRHHHERYDGAGYPGGLRGEAIPFGARILAVADTFDAMTSDRLYRKRLSTKDALDEIEHCSGTQFDPAVAAVARRALGDIP